MRFANILMPDRHQAITNHHVDITVIIQSQYEYEYEYEIFITQISQRYIEVHRQ